MYDRDGGGGRSATPTGFAFVWITCLCHVWSVTGYGSSGLGGGGRAGPNAAGAGRSRWRLFGNACNFGVWAARSVQLHHSVSPEARRRSS